MLLEAMRAEQRADGQAPDMWTWLVAGGCGGQSQSLSIVHKFGQYRDPILAASKLSTESQRSQLSQRYFATWRHTMWLEISPLANQRSGIGLGPKYPRTEDLWPPGLTNRSKRGSAVGQFLAAGSEA